MSENEHRNNNFSMMSIDELIDERNYFKSFPHSGAIGRIDKVLNKKIMEDVINGLDAVDKKIGDTNKVKELLTELGLIGEASQFLEHLIDEHYNMIVNENLSMENEKKDKLMTREADIMYPYVKYMSKEDNDNLTYQAIELDKMSIAFENFDKNYSAPSYCHILDEFRNSFESKSNKYETELKKYKNVLGKGESRELN